MHASVESFIHRALSFGDVNTRDVIEVGSRDVNGSVRKWVEAMRPARYLGIDMLPGRGVDVVMKAEELPFRYLPGSFDTLLCIETIEHVEFWRAAVMGCKISLAPGGVMLFTTRGPGFPLHAYPSDFWRFTPDDFARIFEDMDILQLEPDPQEGHPGVFMKARKPKNWKPVNLEGIQVASVG